MVKNVIFSATLITSTSHPTYLLNVRSWTSLTAIIVLIYLWMKKGLLAEPDKLRGSLHGGLANPETQINHIEWPVIKTSYGVGRYLL